MSVSVNERIADFTSVTHLPSNKKENLLRQSAKTGCILQILFQDTCGAYQNDIPSRNKYNLRMKTISLKLDECIFDETEKILSLMKKPRNRYINEAIENYNKLQKRMMLETKLKMESELVRKDSLAVLKEFEELGYAD